MAVMRKINGNAHMYTHLCKWILLSVCELNSATIIWNMFVAQFSPVEFTVLTFYQIEDSGTENASIAYAHTNVPFAKIK